MKNWNDVRNYIDNDTQLSRIPEGTELIPVAGVTFMQEYPNNLLKLQGNLEDAIVTLKRNPGNIYDGNACEVYVNDKMIGHLPREIAARVSPNMDDGIMYKTQVFQVRVSQENPNNPGIDITIEEL